MKKGRKELWGRFYCCFIALLFAPGAGLLAEEPKNDPEIEGIWMATDPAARCVSGLAFFLHFDGKELREISLGHKTELSLGHYTTNNGLLTFKGKRLHYSLSDNNFTLILKGPTVMEHLKPGQPPLILTKVDPKHFQKAIDANPLKGFVEESFLFMKPLEERGKPNDLFEDTLHEEN